MFIWQRVLNELTIINFYDTFILNSVPYKKNGTVWGPLEAYYVICNYLTYDLNYDVASSRLLRWAFHPLNYIINLWTGYEGDSKFPFSRDVNRVSSRPIFLYFSYIFRNWLYFLYFTKMSYILMKTTSKNKFFNWTIWCMNCV